MLGPRGGAVVNWVYDNREWLFGGSAVGIVAAGIAIWQTKSAARDKSQRQRSGRNSTNTQVGGDLTINVPPGDSVDG